MAYRQIHNSVDPHVGPSRAPFLCLSPQLRKERDIAEETAQRLSDKEAAVRELTARLREMERAAATAKVAAAATVVRTHSPGSVRQVCAAAPEACGCGCEQFVVLAVEECQARGIICTCGPMDLVFSVRQCQCHCCIKQ